MRAVFRQRAKRTAPAGLIVCRWQNSLPHAILMSSGFRGIKRRWLDNKKTNRNQAFLLVQFRLVVELQNKSERLVRSLLFCSLDRN